MTDTKADVTSEDTPVGGAAGQDESHDSPTRDKPGTEQDPKAGEDTDGDDEAPEAPSKEEFERLRRKADRREQKLREAQEELKALREKVDEKPEDPEAKANAKLIRASTRAVLAGVGITDRAVQGQVMGLINLSDIDVDDAGDPDEDEIADRINQLRKALGADVKPSKRTPARDTADRGAGGGTTNPDKVRMQNFLRGR